MCVRPAGIKLGVPSADIKNLVREQDGTEVDEDDVLEGFHKQTLLLLRKNEEWRPDGACIIINGICRHTHTHTHMQQRISNH